MKTNIIGWVTVSIANILGFANNVIDVVKINEYLLLIIYLITIIFLIKKFIDWIIKGKNPNAKNINW